MKNKKVILLILVAIAIVAFTVYSIVKEDLTTVQGMFAKTTQTASTEVIENDSDTEEELKILSSQTEPENDIPTNDTEVNDINEVNNTTVNVIENNNVVANNTTENNVVAEENVSVASINIIKAENVTTTVKALNNVVENNIVVNNTVINNVISLNNITTNTMVNKDKLPAAGVKSVITWTLIILAIISVISHIKYNNIKLK